MLKRFVTLTCCLILPLRLFYWILNLIGHQVHPKSKIGFSLIWIKGRLILHPNSRIGNFNAIRIDELEIKESGNIGNFNNINGPITIKLDKRGVIRNGNSIYRPPLGVSYGVSTLTIGIDAGITSHHRVDCTRSVSLGNYSTIAGNDTQLWTHGYYHDKVGPGRFRLDGDIVIGENVYIGSRCVINGGVRIVDNVVVGANSAVAKSLLEPGTYVNQPLRYIPSNDVDLRAKFKKIDGHTLCEEVYERKDLI